MFLKTFQLLNFNKINGDLAEFGCPDATVQLDAWHALKRQPFQRQLWAIHFRDAEPQTLKTANANSMDLQQRWPASQHKWINPLQKNLADQQGSSGADYQPGTCQAIVPIRKHSTSPSPVHCRPRSAWPRINAQPHSSIRSIFFWREMLDQHWKNGSIQVLEHYFAGSITIMESAQVQGMHSLNCKGNRPDLSFVPMEKLGTGFSGVPNRRCFPTRSAASFGTRRRPCFGPRLRSS